MPPPLPDTLAPIFAEWPDSARLLRDVIFETAAEADIGPLCETLKWGQPAYLTPVTKSGSTIRLGLPKSGGFAMFVHCQTTILSDFRTIFADDFTYDGNRAVVFQDPADLDLKKLRSLVHAALTYHVR